MEDEIKSCEYCDDKPAEQRTDIKGRPFLCDDCYEAYDNKTGHCSLDCCISGKCDDSC